MVHLVLAGHLLLLLATYLLEAFQCLCSYPVANVYACSALKEQAVKQVNDSQLEPPLDPVCKKQVIFTWLLCEIFEGGF